MTKLSEIMDNTFSKISSVNIIKDESLIGVKTVFKTKNDIHVSPAIFHLISVSNGEELDHIFKNITVIEMPTK